MSPRLRRRPDGRDDGPTPPPGLLRCELEDWCDVRTFQPRWVEDDTAEGLYWAAISETRRRWKVARSEWLRRHRIPPEAGDQLIPARAPRAGNDQAVRAAIALRLARRQNHSGKVTRIPHAPGVE